MLATNQKIVGYPVRLLLSVCDTSNLALAKIVDKVTKNDPIHLMSRIIFRFRVISQPEDVIDGNLVKIR